MGSTSVARSTFLAAADTGLVDALLSKFTQCATPLFSSMKEASIEYLRIRGRELEMQDQRRQEEAELERLKLAQAGKFEEQRLAQRNPELEMQEKCLHYNKKKNGT
ncbi:hypothetical protein Tco_0446353 [Tanacetum coccineum]